MKTVKWSEEDQCYVATLDEPNGLGLISAHGDTREDALEELQILIEEMSNLKWVNTAQSNPLPGRGGVCIWEDDRIYYEDPDMWKTSCGQRYKAVSSDGIPKVCECDRPIKVVEDE